MKTILIIEDDISIARLIKTYVSFAGYEAAIAPDGGAGPRDAGGKRSTIW